MQEQLLGMLEQNPAEKLICKEQKKEQPPTVFFQVQSPILTNFCMLLSTKSRSSKTPDNAGFVEKVSAYF